MWWLPAGLVLVCLTTSYWSTVQVMIHQWINDQDYSHGILVPFIVAYLIWQKREALKKANVHPDWRAIPLMLVAIAFFVVGEMAAELFTTRFSMLIFIFGLTWFLFGLQVLKVLLFPLAFLVLMIPLPKLIHRELTFPLQLSSSKGAVNILHLLGISAYREGNIIDVGFMQLQVVEACNGLRYILPLLTLGVLFAYFGQRIFWKRFILVCSTIPVAIFSNILRISGTGVIGLYWGNDAAEGFFHSFSGWVVFMVSIGLFALINLGLKMVPDWYQPKKKNRTNEAHGVTSKCITWSSMVAAFVIVIVSPFIVNQIRQVPPVPIRKPLSAFPLNFEGWKGKRSKMDPKMWKAVGAQDYVLINYYKDGKGPINFYVSYYEFTENPGDLVHTPKMCLPGAGWVIKENRVRRIKGQKSTSEMLPDLMVNEMVVKKGDMTQLTYFWYQGRGRYFTSEFVAKFYRVWDGIFRRRTDGAAVRMITFLGFEQNLEKARQFMDPLAMAAYHELEQYIP